MAENIVPEMLASWAVTGCIRCVREIPGHVERSGLCETNKAGVIGLCQAIIASTFCDPPLFSINPPPKAPQPQYTPSHSSTRTLTQSLSSQQHPAHVSAPNLHHHPSAPQKRRKMSTQHSQQAPSRGIKTLCMRAAVQATSLVAHSPILALVEGGSCSGILIRTSRPSPRHPLLALQRYRLRKRMLQPLQSRPIRLQLRSGWLAVIRIAFARLPQQSAH
ncbi:hypothetical protein DE146DRAFT_145922 [Phaeosphaeria sp. MPI-PUGE-AT-0046c]|nr:hypothetical protein DE146DRAFT_145922 [Phaeosphaeria sp. MPI-PUGE-AT-0046c]